MRTRSIAACAFAVVAAMVAVGQSQTIQSGATIGNGASEAITADGTNLCIGGQSYSLANDDEFTTDAFLYSTPNVIQATPDPSGAIWSTQLNGVGRARNVGTDDAYYADASQTYFGGYQPFNFSTDAAGVRALTITAARVPAPYVTASPLMSPAPGPNEHWLSGAIQGPAFTYGYAEVASQIPTGQGYWPLPLALVSLTSSTTGQEFDAGQEFGSAAGLLQFTDLQSIGGAAQTDSLTGLPLPSSSYHTYGILWTATGVQFYLDHQPTSAFAHPYVSNAPMQPELLLQMFANGTYAPPQTKNPVSMRVLYYRQYATGGQVCRTQEVPAALPLPTAGPTNAPQALPSASPPAPDTSAPAVRQSPAVFAGNGPSPIIPLALAAAPTAGDLLVAEQCLITNSTPPGSIAAPSGWYPLDLPLASTFGNRPSLTTFYHQVAAGESGAYAFLQQVPAAGTTRSVSGILYDIYNQDPTNPIGPHATAANYTTVFYVPTLAPPIAHTLALAFWGADGGGAASGEVVTPGAATFAWVMDAYADSTYCASVAAHLQNGGVGSNMYTTIAIPNNQPYVGGVDIIMPVGASPAP